MTTDVALTFDDGPDPVDTPRLLHLLAERDVTATFFVWGEQAAEHGDVVRSVIEAGHSVQPHCWAHIDHWLMNPETVRDDLDAVTSILGELGAQTPRFWRPPHGHLLRGTTRAIAAERGLALVGWDITVVDWLVENDAATLYARLVGDLTGHTMPVVLMHDGHCEDGQTRPDASNTLEVLRLLLGDDERGYQLVSHGVEGFLEDGPPG